MRTHWGKSIRWRLALWSMLISLLATGLLALAAIFAIAHYYGADQRDRLTSLSSEQVHMINATYEHKQWTTCSQTGCVRGRNLARAAAANLPDPYAQNEQYLYIVYDRRGAIIYPNFAQKGRQNIIAAFLLKLVNPSIQADDFGKLRQAIRDGLGGKATEGMFGSNSFAGIGQPFIIQPLSFTGPAGTNRTIGVLVMTSRSAAQTTIPPFIAAVGGAVAVASLAVAIIAALAAILFSQSITRPLAKMTRAARQLEAGDYSVQVATDGKGEIGELAHSFNEMATQLKRDVEELKQQELWRRELIMSITHDLATPLTAITGLSESLVDGVNQSRDDYEVTGRIIVRETLRLRRLVKDLHVMAKVEAGALQPQLKPLRLAAQVDEILAVLAPEFERAQVEPCNSIPYNLPLVPIDPDMLTRVFSNLFDNALHHTLKGGTVTINASQQNNKLVVSVTDTGEGIPTEALPRVFERFYRADSARQSKKGGSGLGLAIVQAIVEAHHGKVWAENVPGTGARISFTLPLLVSEHAPNDFSTRDDDFSAFQLR